MISRIAIAVCLCVLCPAASADQLVMNNGDKLSGTVERIADGKVTIVTPYAGAIEVDADAVQSLTTDVPLHTVDESGETVPRRFAVWDGEWMVVDETGEAAPAGPVTAARDADAAVPPKPKVWSGSVEAGGSWRSGEKDVLDATLTVTTGRDFGRDRLTMTASAGYGEVDSDVNTRRIKGDARYQHYPNERFFLYAQGGLAHDEPRKLDLRATGGLGAGYDFVKRERLKLSGDAGLEYGYERWLRYSDDELDALRATRRKAAYTAVNNLVSGIQTGALDAQGVYDAARAVRLALDDVDNTRVDRSASARFGLQYEQRVFEKAVLTETLTAWPKLDDWGEYRLLSEAAVVTPLSQMLDLRLSLTSEYQSDTGANGVNWDHLFQAGIVYRF